MSILDDMLDSIIAKSGINFYREEIESKFPADDIMIDMNDAVHYFWNSLPGDARIAIFGLGRDLPFLVNNVDLAAKNVVCMIDNNPKFDEFAGYPVIRSKDIPNYGIDIVIITSRSYYDAMKAEIETVAPDCEIAFMWDAKYSGRYIVEDAFLGYYPKETLYIPVLLNKLMLSYETENDYRLPLCIISVLLEHRDIRNALMYIDKCLNSDHPEKIKLVGLKDSLLDLLSTIKQKLEEQPYRRAVMLIADNMAAKEITPEQTPFLYNLGQNNIFCTNAHSHTPWTSTSILTIISQKSYLDNYLFRDATLTGNEPVFEKLEKSNSDLTYISHHEKRLFKNIPKKHIHVQHGCSDIIWRFLCLAYENNIGGLYILHTDETHPPSFCLYHASTIDVTDIGSRLSECVKYIDSQTEFLYSMLPKSTGFLFSSDHSCCKGFVLYNSPERDGYDNGGHHIPYVICDRITHTGTDERIVSHLDTVDVLLNMLHGESAFANIKKRVFAELNQEFFYSERYFRIYSDIVPHRACKCFITDKDKYIIFYDGEERYHLLSDDSVNLIGDAGYADRVNWFRQNVNTEFPDWNDDNGRYDVSRKYYDIGNT